MKADLTQKAADFIVTQEGFYSKPYWDYKQYTWGYGTKAPAATGTITKDAARLELIKEIAPRYLKVKDLNISDNAKISLISFGFNVGDKYLDLMIDRIKKGWSMQEISTKLQEYNKAGGVVLAGLVNRRKTEGTLLLS